MAVHIDVLAEVTALLISGHWIGVGDGSLRRHQPPKHSSGSTELTYEWTHAGFTYLALAADVQAVQLRPTTAPD